MTDGASAGQMVGRQLLFSNRHSENLFPNYLQLDFGVGLSCFRLFRYGDDNGKR
jgi:hypothetical protein